LHKLDLNGIEVSYAHGLLVEYLIKKDDQMVDIPAVCGRILASIENVILFNEVKTLNHSALCDECYKEEK